MSFNIERKGYNRKEVDDYIYNIEQSYSAQGQEQRLRIVALKKENDELVTKLNAYKNKENMISKALIDAMARAKKIEENSRKIYDLEIQKIRILYNKYKELLDTMIQRNARDEDIDNLTTLTRNFKAGVNKVLSSQNERANLTQNADEKMRALLSKMNSSVKENPFVATSQERKYSSGEQMKMDMDELQVKPNLIKPIYKPNTSNDEEVESLVDKFLDSDEEDNSAYASQILGEEAKTDGFDLKEAVNPTESLEEIMKAFNLDED